MILRAERQSIAGPAGSIECLIEAPAEVAVGDALICHPHPLHGGTMDNKVVVTLARAFLQLGWRAIRFNFRGVGGSAGAWDEGRGEVLDTLAVAAALCNRSQPLALAGFSFGGHVASHAALFLKPQRLLLVAPATASFEVATVPAHTLVVHAEADEVVPLQATLDWARPQSLPVVVVPGGSHFFHGQLPLLKSIVLRHLAAAPL